MQTSATYYTKTQRTTRTRIVSHRSDDDHPSNLPHPNSAVSSAATSKETQLVLDALEMTSWQRDRDQHPDPRGELVHHSDGRCQQAPLFERGITVSYETVRAWCATFGPAYAEQLRRRQYRPGDKWHLDEVFIKVNVMRCLWRAVDQDGHVLDILVTSKRDARAVG